MTPAPSHRPSAVSLQDSARPNASAKASESAKNSDSLTPTSADAHGLLYRIGAFSARRWMLVVTAWVLVLGVVGGAAITGFGGENLFMRLGGGAPTVNGEAEKTAQKLENAALAAAGDDATPAYDDRILLMVNNVDPADTQLATALDPLENTLATLEQDFANTTITLTDPRAGLAASELGQLPPEAKPILDLVAIDGRGILVTVDVTSNSADVGEAASDSVIELLTETQTTINSAVTDADAYVSNSSLLSASYRHVATADLERGEGVALPIALVIMVLVFGGFIAAGIPLIGAIASIISGMGVLFGLSASMELDSMVINIITLLGLGLSLDYGLLMLSRFRQELGARSMRLDRSSRKDPRQRAQVLDAVGTTVSHAGRTVLFSAAVFASAAIALVVFESEIIRSLGIATAAIAALGALITLTLTPALMGALARPLSHPGTLTKIPGLARFFRADSPRESAGSSEKSPGKDTADSKISPSTGPRRERGAGFAAIARAATKRPALTSLAGIAVLVILGLPMLSMTITNDSSSVFPRAASLYPFIESMREDFPAANEPALTLVVSESTSFAANSVQAAEQWAQRLSDNNPGLLVADARTVGEFALVEIRHDTSSESASGPAALELVRDARSIAPNDPLFDFAVTGWTAGDVDFIDSITASAPWAALVIVLTTFVLLFLLTGSVVIPIKSLFIATLSLSAAIGVLVWGFQEGNLAGILNFHPDDVGGVDALLMVIVLVLGFGLSMDYEVFLLGAMTELRDQGITGRDAIVKAVQSTGGIITSAALIMVVVFAGFTVGDLLIVKQLGTALAVIVAVDATLVRLLMVPALMTWQERIMWWSPRFLRPVADRLRIRH